MENALFLTRKIVEGIRHRWEALPQISNATLLWLPAVLVAGIVVLPTAYLVIRTLGADQATWEVLVRFRTLQIIGRTVGLVLAVTSASLGIALPLAWLTTRTDLPLRRVWGVLTVLPLVIPSYIGAYLVVAALGPRGMLQQWLEGLWGIQRVPDIYGFPGALLVITILSYPYILLPTRAALLRIDPAMEEAARSLGQSPWTTFWRVILPQLRPALVSGSLLVALYTLRDFGAVSIMRYDTFTRVIYLQYQSLFDRTSAAVLSLVLVGITGAILLLEVSMRGRVRYHQTSTGAIRPVTKFALGRWRWLALGFCSAVIGIALVLPASVLGYWLVQGLRAGEQMTSFWLAAKNTLFVAIVAAGVTLLAALPIVVCSVRRPGQVSRLLEQVTYSAFALPGIVVALALVFFGVHYARPLYQSFPMLILAYVILFLPQAVGTLRTSWLQVPPSLEEAARSLGHRPVTVFFKIVLPLVRPGLISGASLVFLTTMKELPATLILSPLGFKTLATIVWSAVSEAFFAQAAAPALLLILLSSVPTALLMLRRNPGSF